MIGDSRNCDEAGERREEIHVQVDLPGMPGHLKTSVDGPPIRATATISLVESEFPAVRHETVAAVAIAAIRTTAAANRHRAPCR